MVGGSVKVSSGRILVLSCRQDQSFSTTSLFFSRRCFRRRHDLILHHRLSPHPSSITCFASHIRHFPKNSRRYRANSVSSIKQMRPTLRLRASPTSSAISLTPGTKPGPRALLPPIPLYRRLLRVHRKKLDTEA